MRGIEVPNLNDVNNMNMSKTTHVRVSYEFKDWLTALATAERVSASEILDYARPAIEQYMLEQAQEHERRFATTMRTYKSRQRM